MLKDGHLYSYSQLSSVDECPYSFYLQKIELDEDGRPLKQQDNFFAEHGSLMHKVLEEWARGNISLNEMPDEYTRLYPGMVHTPPPPYMSKYASKAYDVGLWYCKDFRGFDGYDIVSAEERFRINLPLTDGTTREFVGVVDLILKDQETGGLVIMDHKSKSAKEFVKVRDEMYRQQYLYAAYVIEKYGVQPERLAFNLFKENGMIDERPFDKEEYQQTLQWATDKILEIENRDFLEWLDQKEEPDFFCNEICSVRAYCPNGSLKPTPKGRKRKA